MSAFVARNMMMPEISVVLPAYNGSRHIRQQIRSILDQSVTAIELIICDDGSRDDTVAIVADIASAEDRVRLLAGDNNIGQRTRLAELVSAARAPLLAFADQDDVWGSDKLARLRDAMGRRSLVFGSSHLIDGEGLPLNATIADRVGVSPADGDRLGYLFRPYVSAHAALVRRDALSPMTFARAAHFDWLMSLDAAFREGIGFVPEAIVWHRIHEHNQANASFGAAPRWWFPLHPASIYGHFQRKRMRRFTFVGALEHLASSPCIDFATRRDFTRLNALCRGAWFDPGISRPFANPKLARSILSMLTPYAGSQNDLETARREVFELTRV